VDRINALKIIGILKENTLETPKLDSEDPLQLLVATILSAQSTDPQINRITPALFKRYKTVRDYADADIEELEKYVHSSGYYRSKARRIRDACKKILSDFHGEVPDTMDGLISLPGVGRKTANIVLAHGFGKIEGIAVDTHVARVSQRLGFSASKDPERIEKDLLKLLPEETWGEVNHLLIDHGREFCKARKPLCTGCPVADRCAFNLKAVRIKSAVS
jgi:endonuclease III